MSYVHEAFTAGVSGNFLFGGGGEISDSIITLAQFSWFGLDSVEVKSFSARLTS